MNLLWYVLGWIVVTVAIAAPVIYFGVPLGSRGASPTPEKAIAIALVGTVVAGLVGAVGALIPAIGPLLAPLAWVGVVGWLTRARWPTATAVGLLSWAVPLVLVSVLFALL